MLYLLPFHFSIMEFGNFDNRSTPVDAGRPETQDSESVDHARSDHTHDTMVAPEPLSQEAIDSTNNHQDYLRECKKNGTTPSKDIGTFLDQNNNLTQVAPDGTHQTWTGKEWVDKPDTPEVASQKMRILFESELAPRLGNKIYTGENTEPVTLGDLTLEEFLNQRLETELQDIQKILRILNAKRHEGVRLRESVMQLKYLNSVTPDKHATPDTSDTQSQSLFAELKSADVPKNFWTS